MCLGDKPIQIFRLDIQARHSGVKLGDTLDRITLRDSHARHTRQTFWRIADTKKGHLKKQPLKCHGEYVYRVVFTI